MRFIRFIGSPVLTVFLGAITLLTCVYAGYFIPIQFGIGFMTIVLGLILRQTKARIRMAMFNLVFISIGSVYGLDLVLFYTPFEKSFSVTWMDTKQKTKKDIGWIPDRHIVCLRLDKHPEYGACFGSDEMYAYLAKKPDSQVVLTFNFFYDVFQRPRSSAIIKLDDKTLSGGRREFSENPQDTLVLYAEEVSGWYEGYNCRYCPDYPRIGIFENSLK